MLFRIRREIFKAGEFENYHIEGGATKYELCSLYHLDPDTTVFYSYDGNVVDCPDDVIIDDDFLIAIQSPAAVSTGTAILISVGVAIAAAVTYGVGVYNGWWPNLFETNTNTPNAKSSYAYSLRGGSNQRRKGGYVGLLLGQACVTPDMASLVFSDYSDNMQYVNQLFCFGYKDVVLRKSTDDTWVSAVNPNGYMIRIGETPLGGYTSGLSIAINNADHTDVRPVTDFSHYNKRCIEEGLSMKMLGPDKTDPSKLNEITRTSSTNTVRIGVGIAAPYGWYKRDDKGDATALRMAYKIQYRAAGSSGAWSTLADVDDNKLYNGSYYRAMHSVNVTAGQYDIRMWRVNSDSDDDNDTLMVELIQYDTVNLAKWNGTSVQQAEAKLPIISSERYGLLELRAQATDKFNGYLDQINMECFLNCFYYTGTVASDDPTKWVKDANPTSVGDRNNPACALLYMLIDSYANPRALDVISSSNPLRIDSSKPDCSKIDWYALSEWFLFCKSMKDPNNANDDGWKCNAWVTEEKNVGELCSLICLTGRAQFRVIDGKYSVLIEKSGRTVTQMFTPRNAWDMNESRSFDEPIELGKAEFTDEVTGNEIERYAYVDENNVLHYPSEANGDDLDEIENDYPRQETYTIWGVTKAHQVAQLVGYNLLCKRLQTRTYTWNCSLESITCSVGDVVYLANDMFLFSLGYGRITSVSKNSSGKITGVFVDESMGIDSSKSYGITIRTASGVTSSIAVNQATSSSLYLKFSTPVDASESDIKQGNLFIYGDHSQGGKKVLITGISPDVDKNATITAVDYTESVYACDEGSIITSYESGISSYGSGVNISKGLVPPVYVEAGPAGAPGKNGEDSVSVTLLSSNGMIFHKGGDFSTELTAHVYKGGTDITSTITGEHFRWRRSSGDEGLDRIWNNNHYALVGNTISLTIDDIIGHCSFFADYIQ